MNPHRLSIGSLKSGKVQKRMEGLEGKCGSFKTGSLLISSKPVSVGQGGGQAKTAQWHLLCSSEDAQALSGTS